METLRPFKAILLGALILVIVISFFSCDCETRADKSIIRVSEKCAGSLVLKNIIDSVVYVKLETVEAGLINRINKISVFENRIYIHDSSTGSLLVFDINGRFIFKIQKIGKGPDEYMDFNSFCIDRINKLILIQDLHRNRIIKYSIKDGSYAGVLNIIDRKNFARYFAVMRNGNFICYTPSLQKGVISGIWTMDNKGDFRKQLLEEKELYPIFEQIPAPVYIYEIKESQYSVFDAVNNTIYHYDGSNFKKQYQFDFSGLPVKTASMFPGVSIKEMAKMKLKDRIENLSNHDSEHYIYSRWGCNGQVLATLFDKKQGRLLLINHIDVIDGVLGGYVPTENSNILSFQISASSCSQLIKSNPNIGSRLLTMMRKTSSEENAILQLYYLK